MPKQDIKSHKKTPSSGDSPKKKHIGINHPKQSLRQRGIFLLPNLFTTAALFWGFYAIVMAMHGDYRWGAIAIFIAGIFDTLDGRVARLINAQSAFGAEYDSLADMVSFGIGPALVVYNFALSSFDHYGLGKLGWLSAFIFVACGGLRLAKFNVQVTPNADNPKRYFYGLPIPMAAFCIASSVWAGSIYQLSGLWVSLCYAVLVVLLAMLMVSPIRYRSFKDIDLNGKVKAFIILIIVIVFIIITLAPAYTLLVISFVYACSGPVMALVRLRARAIIKKHTHDNPK